MRSAALPKIDQVRSCYADALSRNPDLSGRVFIKFIVSLDGWVKIAASAGATFHDAMLEMCVVEAVKTWTFPKLRSGSIGVVTLPFDLQPASQAEQTPNLKNAAVPAVP